MSVPPESVIPPPPPGPPPSPSSFEPPEPPLQEMPSREERQWALFAHLSALLGGLITSHVWGLGCILGPLIIWLVKKDGMPFVDDQAKEALNFNITVAIVFALLWVFTIATFFIGAFLTIPLGFLIAVAALVLVIVAAIKANEGERYRYPFTLRLIK